MTNWELFCEDCKEYTHIGQGYSRFTFTKGHLSIVESFMAKHEGHSLVVLSETMQDRPENEELSLDSEEYTGE